MEMYDYPNLEEKKPNGGYKFVLICLLAVFGFMLISKHNVSSTINECKSALASYIKEYEKCEEVEETSAIAKTPEELPGFKESNNPPTEINVEENKVHKEATKKNNNKIPKNDNIKEKTYVETYKQIDDEICEKAYSKPVNENKIFDVVEEMPQFPGGSVALFEYLFKNIKYPVVAEENGVQGRVVVTFVVECDGSITNVKVVKSPDPSLDYEARRVVSSMPHWIPGKQNGSAVRTKYTVPVTFRLS